MVTAFRLANGGAQEYFGVIPDLCCIGKAMANGMPLLAILGKRKYMQRLPACGFGMTFRGETFSLVAAKKAIWNGVDAQDLRRGMFTREPNRDSESRNCFSDSRRAL